MGIKVPGSQTETCQPELERSVMKEYVHIKYPEDKWTHTYTEGSAAKATRDGGGGAYIRYSYEKAQITIDTGK